MTATIIDGKKIASQQIDIIKNRIDDFKSQRGYGPSLHVIQVGMHGPSTLYIERKRLACAQVGINFHLHSLPESAHERDLLTLIDRLNNDGQVHGILLQLPLPKHLDKLKILNTISWKKDVDGLNAYNLGLLTMGIAHMVACTPLGCLKLLKSVHQSLAGKHVVIVGRSILVGRSMALLLIQEDATVTITHSKTKDLDQITAQADILIAACGSPQLITKDYVKPGATVIDVGINRIDHISTQKGAIPKIVGDVDFESVKMVAGYITPVPGGVGPMTIASLLENTLKAAISIKL